MFVGLSRQLGPCGALRHGRQLVVRRMTTVKSSDSSLLIGRDRIGVSVNESVEPVELPVQTFDQVLRLSSAREIMVFAREHYDLSRHTEVFERAEPLFALFDRHAKVVIRMQDQSRRLNVCRVLERRAFPIEIEPL